jgi:hypothetical protein
MNILKKFDFLSTNNFRRNIFKIFVVNHFFQKYPFNSVSYFAFISLFVAIRLVIPDFEGYTVYELYTGHFI